MIFDDEPVPGFSLPMLPDHSSPGRLERVLRAGKFAGNDRDLAAGFG